MFWEAESSEGPASYMLVDLSTLTAGASARMGPFFNISKHSDITRQSKAFARQRLGACVYWIKYKGFILCPPFSYLMHNMHIKFCLMFLGYGMSFQGH